MNATHIEPTKAEPVVSVIELAEVRWLCESGVARSVRETAALSLGDVARHIEITPNAISAWERGIARPTGTAAISYLSLLRKLGGIERARRGIA